MPEFIYIGKPIANLWYIQNPILPLGQLGKEYDTGRTKRGDGVTHWNDLAYDVPLPIDITELTDRVYDLERTVHDKTIIITDNASVVL